MLKTNSKAVNEKIKNIIIECYKDSGEYYGFEGREMASDYAGMCKDIMNAFYIEKVKMTVIIKPAASPPRIFSWTGCRDFRQRLALLMMFSIMGTRWTTRESVRADRGRKSQIHNRAGRKNNLLLVL